MKPIFVVILAIHGVIHFVASAKAFQYAGVLELSHPIAREMGILWLTGGLLIAATTDS